MGDKETKMSDFKFEITESLGVLSENAKGWTKELNKVSWNGRDPNMTSGNGIRSTSTWVRGLRLPMKNSRN